MSVDPLNPYGSPESINEPHRRNRESEAKLDPPIRVSGVMNRREIEIALAMSQGSKQKWLFRPNLLFVLVLAIWAISTLVFVVQHPNVPGGYIALVALLALLYWALAIRPRQIRQEIEIIERHAEEADYGFTTTGFNIQAEMFAYQVVWAEVSSFRDSGEMIYLFTNQMSVPIPRRWFRSSDDFERLIRFLGHVVEMSD
jgi:hypothetical protein